MCDASLICEHGGLTTQPRLTTLLVLAASFSAIALAALADRLGIGGQPGFGAKQAILALTGLALALLGLLAATSRPLHRIAATYHWRRRSLAATLLLFALLSVAGSLALLWLTPYGAAIQVDSIPYLDAARSLVAGHGLAIDGEPLTHFPPGYPSALALAGVLSPLDVVTGAHYLAALLFGLNLFLLALAAILSTTRSLAPIFCVLLLFVASAPVLSSHVSALSEPLFITFSLSAYIAIASYLTHPRPILLPLGGLLIGLAFLTRYLGAALLPPAVIALLLLSPQNTTRRVLDTVVVALLAYAPMGAWMAHNASFAGNATNRSLSFHPVGWSHLQSLVAASRGFVFPAQLSTVFSTLQLIGLGGVCAAALWMLYRNGREQGQPTTFHASFNLMSIMYIMTYLTALVVSMSFFDAHTPLDTRLLLPLWPLVLLVSVSVVWCLALERRQPFWWWAFVGFLFLSFTFNGDQARYTIRNIHSQGVAFEGKTWLESATVQAAAELPEQMEIYSNGPDVFRFVSGREALWVPRRVSPSTRQDNAAYRDEVRDMCEQVTSRGAAVVYLNGITWRDYLPTLEEIATLCEGGTVLEHADGAIYAAGRPAGR